MKRLLATTAIASSMAFAGAASAESLLEQIMAEVEATQVSLLNSAENLADIDATVNIEAFGASGLEAVLEALAGDLDGSFTGMFSEVAFTDGGQIGSGEFFNPADIIAALQTQVDDVSTTAIGALNTGVVGTVLENLETVPGVDENGDAINDVLNSTTQISGTVMNLQNAVAQSVTQTSNSLATSTTFEAVDPVQVANLALNNADDLNASVNVAQLLANVDGISTTAIGALNTGNIATDIATNTTSLTEAIVGR
ncbi:MAG: hypothetical protein JJU42_07135 [Rhodobacteraceae bacterium]|nr:hypothetical protein [Paracoccaceae bacterium]